MLDHQIARQYMYDTGYGDRDHSPAKLERARDMFHRAYTRGRLRRWFRRRIVAKDSAIMELNTIAHSLSLRHRWSAGIHEIAVEDIRGTVGRADDFDIDFAPRHRQSESRWVEMAVARFNEQILPPIYVIQVGRVYFVVDGHHRVSVAKALGERFIEAEITIWN